MGKCAGGCQIRTGILIDEPIVEYHAQPALSHSKLQDFRKLPALYHARHIAKTIPPLKKTDAMDVGNAIDCALLEPALWQEKVAVLAENHNGRTNEGKAYVAMLEAKGLTILTPKERALVDEMTSAVKAHPEASALLSVGRPQVSFRRDFGFAHIQCRPDWWNPEGITLPSGEVTGPYYVSLKSARSLDKADFGSFHRTFLDKQYHRGEALYREVIRDVLSEIAGEQVPEVRTFMIVVDKNDIVCCEVFEPTQRTMDLARNELIDDLGRFARCVQSGVWPSRPTGIQSLDLPEWYLKRAERAEAE